MAKKAAAKAKPKIPSTLEFDYIKSRFFRVISIDGAFGGVSPNGKTIHMAVYTERRAIPTKTVHPIADGVVQKEDPSLRQSRIANIREVEADIALSLETAVALQTWLQEKIEQLAKSQGYEVVVEEAAVELRPKAVKAAKEKATNGH